MSRISLETPLAFGYFPQYYLEFVLDVFRPLFFSRRSVIVLPEKVLDEFVSFLVGHVNDGRVANPEVRDVLMQQLNYFLVRRRILVLFFSQFESSVLFSVCRRCCSQRCGSSAAASAAHVERKS